MRYKRKKAVRRIASLVLGFAFLFGCGGGMTVFGSEEDKKNAAKYLYPHNFGGYVEQQYLPDSLKDRVYYTPQNNGYENTVKEIRKRKGKKR